MHLFYHCGVYSITKKVGPLSFTRRCLIVNSLVLIVKVINQVIHCTRYIKSVQLFDMQGVFIKHAHEQYDAMITLYMYYNSEWLVLAITSINDRSSTDEALALN